MALGLLNSLKDFKVVTEDGAWVKDGVTTVCLGIGGRATILGTEAFVPDDEALDGDELILLAATIFDNGKSSSESSSE